MKNFLFVVVFVIFTSASFAQTPRLVYDDQNNLVAVYNLSPKYDCGVRNIVGVVTSVGKDYPDVYFDVKTAKSEETIEIHTDILSNADRTNLFFSLLKKGKKVEISGYTCGSNGVLDVISIKAVTKPKASRKPKNKAHK
ncbi:MAG: hypothetical protein H0X72_01690 [Acidobacteria bacterium]|jgi:hypothetical protein|nr:hypothetical protein [Acidobacteriota bacterium]